MVKRGLPSRKKTSQVYCVAKIFLLIASIKAFWYTKVIIVKLVDYGGNQDKGKLIYFICLVISSINDIYTHFNHYCSLVGRLITILEMIKR